MKKRLAILAGFLWVAVAGAIPAASAPAAPAPVPPYAAGLAGTETRLLPGNYDIWSCDWSPDAKRMAFAAKMQGEESGRMRTWLWSLDPVANPAAITGNDPYLDFTPRWSPDGARLAIVRRSTARSNTGTTAAIWLRDMATGTAHPLTQGGNDRDPSWSPDGSQIVFSRAIGPFRAQLMIVNVADGATRVLAGGDNEILTNPWWGRDGRIYFTRIRPVTKKVSINNQHYQVQDFGKGSIWSLAPEERTAQPVLVDDYDNRSPALAPDGQWLAFVSNRIVVKDGNGKFDRGGLYVKNIASGAVYFITNKVALIGGSLAWSPDGRKLAFFTYRSIRPAIWVIALPAQVPPQPAAGKK
ncbi:Tol biopolymer transport system component [Hydrogenispora ethanolica]|uniref:Tol biopolymer transport system component n=1 Tax=Hydrogenispora ethanolica TaxID=1082276 RepID=A0A4R1S235_HYDET|nr:DPP IV N-terminal domain-containing protein [Hydrogenispora ethanolica]TCL73226.1 Tol biopolymer transport system component [Hydrogenispora ethanolica]